MIDYFPLEPGRFWVYEVSEQRFSLNGTSTLQTFQLREVITGSATDPIGGTVLRTERYRRASDGDVWQPDSAGSIRIYDDQLIKTESNVSYLKLVLPVTESGRWNGNAYNSLGDDEYLVRNTGRPLSVLNQTFAETATVVQQNDSTLVNQDKRIEIYARDVGLVYKEKIQLQFCSSTPTCVGKAQIDYGIRFYWRLRSYGKL
ncbi:hypothetical protein [Larkinella terrae]|uniref:Uncharacterized protein n=1 Tax=Larkinella terrae TaxID=2025311 RepID=A0A7K0EJQ2_9BACT|nr:hypothetical protein [Larkinella terrae]MRS62080.1 hypothetical protein [Larkinella terrae]